MVGENGAFWELCSLKTEQMDRIVWVLFPALPVRVDDSFEGVEDCPLFFIRKLEEAVLSMKIKKESEPDGIPI